MSQAQTLVKDNIVFDVKDAPPKQKEPRDMLRGEFEAWCATRGRGVYDVYHDRMLFRCRNGVYHVEMPVRFPTHFVDGIVYALTEDVIKYGKLR